MIKSDRWIEMMCENPEIPMIEPFVKDLQTKGIISYGLSSYGYDCRIADEFRIFSNTMSKEIDPKNFDPQLLTEVKGVDSILIPPNSFALARTVEYFRIPRNVITICVGKSTYARVGVIVNVTPFEPEWQGFATMEISNSTTSPVRIYSNEGIAQILFFESDEFCRISYADRKGKYDKQMKLTLPFVEK